MKTLLCFLLLAAVLAAAPTADRIDLGAGKSAVVTLPESWKAAPLPPQPPGAPALGATVQYVPRSGANEAVFISLINVPDDRLANADDFKTMAEIASERFASDSVEGKANLKEFKVGGRAGLACVFTDAKLVGRPPVKDDYKTMTRCYVYLGDRVMMTATIFSDDPAGESYAAARRIIQSLTLTLPQNTI